LWQADEAAMRSALPRHDQLLRQAIAEHDGTVFSAMGDGMAAAFGSASAAVAAAVVAQRALEAELWPTASPLRVRMGLHTGEAERRDGDYFGTVVNRAARLMAIGHGGQVLCSSTTAELVGDAHLSLTDLGQHRLRDLDRPIHVFQVGGGRFPALGSLDHLPGNLPEQATSFVGRQAEVAELVGQVGAHRMVTLTGAGGVGKTRLALQVAAELAGRFDAGVWLVELAPVGDPAAVADAVATTLGVTPRAGSSVADGVAVALSGRHMLVLMDNCEHLLEAVTEMVEAILARATTVKVLATSREGLRAAGEQVWPVPSLDVAAGVGSAAVDLFVARAQAVLPGFGLGDPHDAAAVIEICRQLDGMALAIELAAARMVSMNPAEVRDRLGDRFRLLSGSRRGLARHQTLRHAVGWSYELLDDEERTVLTRCAVFVGGFDLAAAVAVVSQDRGDEYGLLDVVDSLVRKSLVTAEQVTGHTRYGMLETIRQFAQDQLAATGTIGDIRDRHARYFAQRAVAHWDMWDGPGQRVAVDWVDIEFANLRTGFRWAADQHDLATAAAIAAHTAMLAWPLDRCEPAGWAEEILEAARAVELAQLSRLYTAASLCVFTGRVEAAVGFAQAAVAMQDDSLYEPFDPAWTHPREASAHLVVPGGYRPGNSRARSGAWGRGAGPGAHRHRHRQPQPGWQRHHRGHGVRQPGDVLRPDRSARRCRHPLRRQHQPRPSRHHSQRQPPPRHREPPARRARRRRVRPVRRHRGRHGPSRRRRLRQTPHRTRPPPSRRTPPRHATRPTCGQLITWGLSWRRYPQNPRSCLVFDGGR
jgi:predicted ATPase